ncbi:hypothetical protein RF11_04310 [Thelohanellus kitauei]|uniref:Thioredoxin domain-containing protein n=1 Tax=Thelohanellus kitauei TaxID=669202 RepID=A0A0C2MDN2_THEKT|nr:hypothetical protein RF11_04310 [Thelohanellus kitauei]
MFNFGNEDYLYVIEPNNISFPCESYPSDKNFSSYTPLKEVSSLIGRTKGSNRCVIWIILGKWQVDSVTRQHISSILKTFSPKYVDIIITVINYSFIYGIYNPMIKFGVNKVPTIMILYGGDSKLPIDAFKLNPLNRTEGKNGSDDDLGGQLIMLRDLITHASSFYVFQNYAIVYAYGSFLILLTFYIIKSRCWASTMRMLCTIALAIRRKMWSVVKRFKNANNKLE